jgi:archaellum component FlaF (FlaF/FlaG flagellin family)
MELTKEVVADKIEVIATEDGQVVQVRTATRILEGGAVISQSFHRHVISAGDDYSSESANVQAVCAAVFGG